MELTVGDRLKFLRKNNGLTMDRLVEILNERYKLAIKNKSTVSMWENNNASPSIDTIICLSDFYKVSTDFILKGTIVKTDSRAIQVETDIRALLTSDRDLYYNGHVLSRQQKQDLVTVLDIMFRKYLV